MASISNLELLVIATPREAESEDWDLATIPRCARAEPRPGIDWAPTAACRAAGACRSRTTRVVESGWVEPLPTRSWRPRGDGRPGFSALSWKPTRRVVELSMAGRGFQRLRRSNPARRLAHSLRGIGLYGTGANMATEKRVEKSAYSIPRSTSARAERRRGSEVLPGDQGGYTMAYDRGLVRIVIAPTTRSVRANRHEGSVFLSRHLFRHSGGNRPCGRVVGLSTGAPKRMIVNQLRGHSVDETWSESSCGRFALTRYSRFPAQRARAAGRTNTRRTHRFSSSRARARSPAVRSRYRNSNTHRGCARIPEKPCFRGLRGGGAGSVEIANLYNVISLRQLRTRIAQWLWLPMLERLTGLPGEVAVDVVMASVLDHDAVRAPHQAIATAPAPPTLSVSVVVTALDRAQDLRLCLRACFSARTRGRRRRVDITRVRETSVVRNSDFKLVNENRRGATYARNRGIAHSTGDVVVTTDDDVIAAPEWLERLLSPFARPEVSVVTGATFPVELETVSQQLFERYRHPRLHSSFEVNHAWFSQEDRAAPTWTLGATTNAAFRAQLFREPHVGLLSEVLGPGTKAGDAEDSYLFYRILKAGHVIVHEPAAIVWQRHERKMAALRRRVFDDGKGHVAYQLHTVLCDRDLRALRHLMGTLAPFRARQLLRILRNELRGTNEDPLLLAMIQLAGNVAGPIELLRSYDRVRRLGRSVPLSEGATAESSSDHARSEPR